MACGCGGSCCGSCGSSSSSEGTGCGCGSLCCQTALEERVYRDFKIYSYTSARRELESGPPLMGPHEVQGDISPGTFDHWPNSAATQQGAASPASAATEGANPCHPQCAQLWRFLLHAVKEGDGVTTTGLMYSLCCQEHVNEPRYKCQLRCINKREQCLRFIRANCAAETYAGKVACSLLELYCHAIWANCDWDCIWKK